MKPKIFSGYLSSAFYLTLLSVAFPLSAEEQKGIEIHLSEIELQEIFNNPKRSYVYVGREVSNIAEVMEELSKLDENQNSLIHGLLDHIRKGFAIGNYDAVAQALEEAEQVLLKNGSALGEEKAAYITRSLNTIIEQVIEEKLNLDAEILSFLKDSAATEDLNRGCNPHTHGLRLLVIKEKIDVLGKAKFRNDVTFKDDVKFEDDVLFEDEVTFEDDVTIEGTLSVADQVIGCDVTVGCNINMNNSTSALVGNILKGGARFMSNFGANSTFLGTNSGNPITTALDNTGLGFNALSTIDTGAGNTAVGARSLQQNIDGDANTAVGVDALANNTGDNNTAVGFSALTANTTGEGNTAVGRGALNQNISGSDNTALGDSTLVLNTADDNTAVGAFALNNNTTGANNTACGSNALASNTTGQGNSAFGVAALQFNTIGLNNVAIGHTALQANTTGNSNIAVGVAALDSNTTGVNNIGIGVSALTSNTIGTSNTALGYQAMQTSIGSNNTGIGLRALRVVAGSNNIGLGINAGVSLTTGDNNVYIANVGAAVESDTIRIGSLGTQTRCFVQGINGVVTAFAAIPVLVDGLGQLGTISSSAEVKHNIQDMNDASSAIYNLRPVTFVFNGDASETTRYGLIAEEVDQVFPALAVKDQNGKVYAVHYETLPALILNELHKLAARVAALEARQ